MATSDIEKLHGLAAEAELLRIHYTSGMITKEIFRQKSENLKQYMEIILSDEHADRVRDYKEIIDGTLKLLRE